MRITKSNRAVVLPNKIENIARLVARGVGEYAVGGARYRWAIKMLVANGFDIDDKFDQAFGTVEIAHMREDMEKDREERDEDWGLQEADIPF